MSGVVYLIDENNEIISERKMDFNVAVYEFMGKRDNKNRKYYISVEGKEVPFRYKKKSIVIPRQDKSVE